MAELNLVQAVNQALARAMTDDPSVVVFGQDVGIHGGVFRATEGLYQRFGGNRVMDAPLDETTIGGLAVGMATQGLRPVCEIQFIGFIFPVLDNLANHAARMRTRTRGRLSCPLVLRTTCGGLVHAPEHHSDSLESLLIHIPGIRVVIPSSPRQAYGLLLSAIRDPDPVVFLEPTRLYRAFREEVPDDGEGAKLDCLRVTDEGSDVTIVAWGAMHADVRKARGELSARGISAEIIDAATLKPFDADVLLNSVEKTGRCVIVHEAARTLGFGAEIAAILAERAMPMLLAPVERVTGYDTVIPMPRLEAAYFPSKARIIDACERVMRYC